MAENSPEFLEEENAGKHRFIVATEMELVSALHPSFLALPQGHIRIKIVGRQGKLAILVTAHSRAVSEKIVEGISGDMLEVLCG